MAKSKRHPHAHVHARAPSTIAGDGALLLDEVGAEKKYGVSRFLFRKMRRTARGPVVTVLGRLCRYRVSDIESWLDANRETPAEFAAARVAKRKATAASTAKSTPANPAGPS
jgi:hypothetical protein